MILRPTFALVALLALVPSTANADGPVLDSFRFGMFIAGEEQGSWTLRADGEGEADFHGVPNGDGPRTSVHQRIAAPEGGYASVLAQVARYRALALPDPGCQITREGVMAFRLSWREAGITYHASFSDNCGGIPTDFFETMRPVGERVEAWTVD
jgi:hypothetical protein